MTHDQLVLPLKNRIPFLESDLIAGCFNADAVEWVNRWPNWPLPKIICIYGPKGCGKTFLAALWKQHTQAFEITESKISQTSPFDVCENFKNIIIDDAHLIKEDAWLYNLFNTSYKNPEISILLTATIPPKHWQKIPDLVSRMASITSVEIHQPNDDDLKNIILKFFHHRGVEVSQNVIQFLLNHMDRSLESLQLVCLKLDSISKALKRSITIPLIQENFDKIFL